MNALPTRRLPINPEVYELPSKEYFEKKIEQLDPSRVKVVSAVLEMLIGFFQRDRAVQYAYANDLLEASKQYFRPLAAINYRLWGMMDETHKAMREHVQTVSKGGRRHSVDWEETGEILRTSIEQQSMLWKMTFDERMRAFVYHATTMYTLPFTVIREQQVVMMLGLQALAGFHNEKVTCEKHINPFPGEYLLDLVPEKPQALLREGIILMRYYGAYRASNEELTLNEAMAFYIKLFALVKQFNLSELEKYQHHLELLNHPAKDYQDTYGPKADVKWHVIFIHEDNAIKSLLLLTQLTLPELREPMSLRNLQDISGFVNKLHDQLEVLRKVFWMAMRVYTDLQAYYRKL